MWSCPRLLQVSHFYDVACRFHALLRCGLVHGYCRFHTFTVWLVGFTSFGVALSTAFVDLTVKYDLELDKYIFH